VDNRITKEREGFLKRRYRKLRMDPKQIAKPIFWDYFARINKKRYIPAKSLIHSLIDKLIKKAHNKASGLSTFG
jgi:hypothetical protein